MARIRRLLPAAVAAVLLVSLLFVNGSIAQPLGAGLLAQFGLRSDGSSSSTDDAILRFGLPVTVMNDTTQAVPVTVQGFTNQPLTTTIDGTVSTQDVNDPTAQPFDVRMTFDFGHTTTSGIISDGFTVPDDKRLIIRYVSGHLITSDLGEAFLSLQFTSDGVTIEHFIPEGSVARSSSRAHHMFGQETWINIDPGTGVGALMQLVTDNQVVVPSADVAISGFLVDAS